MAQGIVGTDEHEAARQAHVGGGEQRIGRDVDAHVLHGGHAHGPGKRGACGHLDRDLLVDGIFHAEPSARGDGVEGVRNFGRRGSRIAGHDVDPCLQRPPDDGLVAEKQVPGARFLSQ